MNVSLSESKKPVMHVFSSGRSVDDIFAETVQGLPINFAVVLNPPIDNDKQRAEIGESITKLENKCREFKIDFRLIDLPSSNLEDVRDEVIELINNNPQYKMYFNITAGKKLLSLYLLLMSVWLDAIPYYVEQNGDIITLEIPKIHRNEIQNNPYLLTFLEFLYNTGSNKGGLPYSQLFERMTEAYKGQRVGLSGRPPKLPKGTFSRWARKLVELQLVDEAFEGSGHKKKMLKITSSGIFTYKFYRKN